MNTEHPSIADLFRQLGLASDTLAIDNFIEQHKGLNKSTYLHKAPFWNNAQSAFLREAIIEDADWSEVIDELNVRLH